MFLRPSTLGFGAAKSLVCESAGTKQDPDSVLQAGRCIQAAIRQWNTKANWKWLRVTTDEYTVVGGTDTYTLPALCKNVHSVRMTGAFPRTLSFIQRRMLNRMSPNQTFQNRPYAYDLFRSNSEGGKLRLIDIPAVAETMIVDYYRSMVIPCNVAVTASGADTTMYVNRVDGIPTHLTFIAPTTVAGVTIGSVVRSLDTYASASAQNPFYSTSGGLEFTVGSFVSPMDLLCSTTTNTALGLGTQVKTWRIGGDDMFLDIPSDYEDGIIALATYLYLINRSSGGPRLQYWGAESQKQLTDALAANFEDTPDEETCILPPDYSNTISLSPNDIRWADMDW
jgi:hypothetical protein